MAQTDGAMSWENAKVEIAFDAAFAYPTDISGSSNKASTSGGEISKATANTHGTLEPLIGYGAAGEREVEVGCLYTEDADESYRLAEDAYTDKSDVWLRVTPDGVAGTRRFVTSVGRIISPPQISGEAGKADFVQTSFKVSCSKLTWEAVA